MRCASYPPSLRLFIIGSEFMAARQAVKQIIDLRLIHSTHVRSPARWTVVAVRRQPVRCHKFYFALLYAIKVLECPVLPLHQRSDCCWIHSVRTHSRCGKGCRYPHEGASPCQGEHLNPRPFLLSTDGRWMPGVDPQLA
jgi:hypothetical protein